MPRSATTALTRKGNQASACNTPLCFVQHRHLVGSGVNAAKEEFVRVCLAGFGSGLQTASRDVAAPGEHDGYIRVGLEQICRLLRATFGGVVDRRFVEFDIPANQLLERFL